MLYITGSSGFNRSIQIESDISPVHLGFSSCMSPKYQCTHLTCLQGARDLVWKCFVPAFFFSGMWWEQVSNNMKHRREVRREQWALEEMQGILCKILWLQKQNIFVCIGLKNKICVCHLFLTWCLVAALALWKAGSSARAPAPGMWRWTCGQGPDQGIWLLCQALKQTGCLRLTARQQASLCLKMFNYLGAKAPKGVRRGKGQLVPATLENIEQWIKRSVFLVDWTL